MVTGRVEIDRSAAPLGYVERAGGAFRMLALADEWGAPAARVLSIAGDPIAANVEIAAWIAEPLDDAARVKGAEALAACILHDARAAGRIDRRAIPDRLQAEHHPKDERSRNAARLLDKMRRRVKAAGLIAVLLAQRNVRGVAADYSIDEALDAIGGDAANVRKRIVRPLSPVAHLALTMARRAPCDSCPPSDWLREAERARRLFLPVFGIDRLAVASTWQFRPE